jgi:hypothetical protein
MRDEILGAALRSLEVPPHRPGFQAELRARLGTPVPERDTARQDRPARPDRAPRPRGRVRHPLRWALGLAAAAAVALAAVLAVPLSGGAPASAAAVARRAAAELKHSASLPNTTLRSGVVVVELTMSDDPWDEDELLAQIADGDMKAQERCTACCVCGCSRERRRWPATGARPKMSCRTRSCGPCAGAIRWRWRGCGRWWRRWSGDRR